MGKKVKKVFKIIGIFATGVTVVILMELCAMLIPEYIIESLDAKERLEYYDETLPSTEIELPYSIRDYEKYDKLSYWWYFDSLTAKVKENKRGKDFWVYQDNYDILFGSDDNLYIRKDSSFTTDITADMVSEISFSDTFGREHPIKLVPDFTNEEITQFAEILLFDSALTKEICEEKYLSYDNGMRITWKIVFKLKSTDEISYDGLSVTHNEEYWLVQDEEGNLYLKDLEWKYKPLPYTLADKIEQCFKKENIWFESAY